MFIAVLASAGYAATCLAIEYFKPGAISMTKNLDSLEKRRIVGFGPLRLGPVSTAGYMSIYLYLAVVLFNNHIETRRKTFIFIAGLILLIFIYYTGSRTAYLAILLSLFSYPCKKSHAKIAFFSFFLIFIYFNYAVILERGLSYRPAIWKSLIKLCMENLFFGHGYANIISIKIPGGYKIFSQAHNIFIEIFYFGGIVGLAMFVLLICRSVYIVFKSSHDEIGIFSRMVIINGLVFVNFSSTGIRTQFGEFYYYFLLSIGMSVLIEARELSKRKAEIDQNRN